ncbi:Del-3 [Aphelenchoides bicaudatus]|nr:Del-3 [Aphelenchoides bicaudatus]
MFVNHLHSSLGGSHILFCSTLSAKLRKNFNHQVETSYERLSLPNLIFCNRLPFTQPGLDRLGSAFNQPLVTEYLQNWLNPSLPDSPEALVQNTTFLQQAELTISQTLLGQSFKERIDSTLATCLEMVSGCSVQGNRMSGIDCCSAHVQSYLPTMSGLCWVFNATSSSQKTFGVYQGIRVDFRISRTNFEPAQHPGIDVYLLPSHYKPLQVATELRSATSSRLRTKTYSHLERPSDCGYTPSDANQADQSTDASKWVSCLVKATIKTCKCVPLNVVLWVYRGDFSGQIISELNATSICTVGEYDRCARAYMDFSQPQQWNSETPNVRPQLKQDVDACKRQHHLPCQTTEYQARPIDYSLTADLQASSDFVSSVSYAFESLEVEDEVRQQSIPLVELASYAGWNLAFWFAVGFIIWIFFTTSCCRYRRPITGQQAAKVAPGPSLVSSGAGSPASRPDSGQHLVHGNALPPINSARSHDVLAQRLHLNS